MYIIVLVLFYLINKGIKPNGAFISGFALNLLFLGSKMIITCET